MRYNVYKYNVVELMSMKTCKQLSSEWGVAEHTIADLCRKGKISGAEVRICGTETAANRHF